MTLESIAQRKTAQDFVALKVRLRLTEMGQSQAALARALGQPPMWVSARLSGTTQMTVNDLAEIAQALGCDMSVLMPTYAYAGQAVLPALEPEPELVGAGLAPTRRVGSPMSVSYPTGGRPPGHPMRRNTNGPRHAARTGR